MSGFKGFQFDRQDARRVDTFTTDDIPDDDTMSAPAPSGSSGRKAYSSLMGEIRKGQRFGAWVATPQSLCAGLGAAEAVILTGLAASMSRAADSGGWMHVSKGFLRNGYGDDAEDCLFRLERDGYIEVQDRKGLRFIRLHVEAIRQAMFDKVLPK